MYVYPVSKPLTEDGMELEVKDAQVHAIKNGKNTCTLGL